MSEISECNAANGMAKRSPWRIFFFSFGALAVPMGLALYWVYADQHPPFWDRRSYLTLARAVADAFDSSPIYGLKFIWGLTGQDYNGYYVVALWPFLAGKTTSLDQYLVALLVVFLPVFYFACFLVGRQLVAAPMKKQWIYALPLIVLAPMGWVVSLGGLPDLLPAAVMAFGILALLKFLPERRIPYLIVGALCLAIAMVLRRHFAYPAVSALAVLAAMVTYGERRKSGGLLRPLVMGGGVSLIAGLVIISAVAVLVPEFLAKAISQRHLSAYSSYVNQPGDVIRYALSMGGWIFLLLVAGGWIALLRFPSTDRHGIVFVGAWLLLWFAIWTMGVGYVNAHYFFGIWVIAISIGLWGVVNLLSAMPTLWRSVGLTMLYAMLWISLVLTLFPSQSGRAKVDGSLLGIGIWPMSNPPSDGNSLVRFGELLGCISAQTGKAPASVLVTASSGALNRDVLLSAYEMVKPKGRLNFVPVPEVDSRDASPLSVLLQSDIAISATPFQHHLGADKQKVVAAANAAFTMPGLIRDGYYRRICSTTLPGDVKVDAFQRRRPMDGALFSAFVEASMRSGKPNSRWVVEQDGFEWASATDDAKSSTLFGNAGTLDRPTIFTMTQRIAAGSDINMKTDVRILNEACGKIVIDPVLVAADGTALQRYPPIPITGANPTLHLTAKSDVEAFLQLRLHTGSLDKSSMGGCGARFSPDIVITPGD